MIAAGILLICCVFQGGLAKPESRACTGYQACPASKLGMLNVHLVPHTHDDVGWLKTVDQYYYGYQNKIQNAGVQYILDSVLDELQKDPTRRFIWVETAFLWQWWREQSDIVRAQVRSLVDSGRLEIISGGWSMNDEAATYYQCTIDQFTWGFRILDDMLGTCGRPHIGWQIDPFGHSRETASIMAQMGFDGLFIARLDYQDKDFRLATKTAEFIWQASANQGESSWLFTHVLYNQYAPPPGFCFDLLCNGKDEPFIDNSRSPDYNVDKKVEAFLSYVKTQAESYRTNNVILTMGEDFFYQNANMWYKNLDKLIRYVNELQSTENVNVFYSTPSCYLKAVHESNLTYITKQDDFFPYPNDAHSYWTGYYTSRPTQKYFERKGNNFLQVIKQLHALASLPLAREEDITPLREVMGVMQHHDAITGTEKAHVAADYALSLDKAFKIGHNVAQDGINTLMAKSSSSPVVSMEACPLLNISSCGVTENNERFVVTAYNPLSHQNSMYLRLPVIADDNTNYQVLEPLGSEIQSQLVPIPQAVINIPGRESSTTFELVFRAVDLPPLGFKSYYVQRTTQKTKTEVKEVNGRDKFIIRNEHLSASFDESTGRLNGVQVQNTKLDFPINHGFHYYEGYEGNNLEANNRSSGAYVFRPRSQDAVPLGDPQVITYKGELLEEIHQQFSPWLSQVIRLYKDEQHFEFEWLVGPIDIADNIGKEMVSRFSTGWATDGLFYTDSNGREVLERKRNYRPTWEVNIQEPVSGNYYPVTSFISIKSGTNTLAVLTDRAQGGSSVRDGEIELMVHRRLLVDDRYGVNEPLNEMDEQGVGLVVRGRHIVLVGNGQEDISIVAQQRQLSQSRMVLAPWLLMAPTQLSLQQWSDLYNMEFSGLNSVSVPPAVHILTLEPWGEDGRVLLRLEHMYETEDDISLSNPAAVTLEDMFSGFTVLSADEMTLGGNIPLAENARFSWSAQDSKSEQTVTRHQNPDLANRFYVELQPMQIRTFIVKLQPRV